MQSKLNFSLKTFMCWCDHIFLPYSTKSCLLFFFIYFVLSFSFFCIAVSVVRIKKKTINIHSYFNYDFESGVFYFLFFTWFFLNCIVDKDLVIRKYNFIFSKLWLILLMWDLLWLCFKIQTKPSKQTPH